MNPLGIKKPCGGVGKINHARVKVLQRMNDMTKKGFETFGQQTGFFAWSVSKGLEMALNTNTKRQKQKGQKCPERRKKHDEEF